VFTVELGAQDPDVTQALESLKFVQGVRREGAVYRVVARDVAAARKHLPGAILDTGVTLVRYGVESPTLEDIFLKVVGEQ
jgi:hypothetical protein